MSKEHKELLWVIIAVILFVGIGVGGIEYMTNGGSFGPSVKIEQEVKINSLRDCTYMVKTYVWVYNYPERGDMHIEKSFYQYDVRKEDIKNIEFGQMLQAVAVEESLEELLASWFCNDILE